MKWSISFVLFISVAIQPGQAKFGNDNSAGTEPHWGKAEVEELLEKLK